MKNQTCPICFKKTLTLSEKEMDIPYFGRLYLFGMDCNSCDFKKHDLEFENPQNPSKITFTSEGKKDLDTRLVKSSSATLKIPTFRMTINPGPDAEGYVSNIEGLLNRIEEVIKKEKENAEEPETKKKAKNLLKKIWKAKCGEIPVKIIIEDPTGNSAIISDKAEVTKIKPKKS